MKQIIIIFLLFWTGSILSQQETANDYKVTWGEEFKLNSKSQVLDVIATTRYKMFILSGHDKNFEILSFDKSLKLLEHKPIDLNTEKGRMNIEGLTQLNDKLIIFLSDVNKKSKQNILYFKALNLDNLKFTGKLQAIGEISFKKKSRSGYFRHRLSGDSSKLLIYHALPFTEGGPEKYGFSVFNADLSLLWKKEVSLPFSSELFHIINYRVSNRGDVVLAGIEYRQKAQINSYMNYGNYHLLTYTNKGGKVKDYELDIGDKFIRELQFAVDDKNIVRCGGFYSRNIESGIKGAFYIKLNLDENKIIGANFKAFDDEFIVEELNERQRTKARIKQSKGKESVELDKYYMRDFIFMPDGGIVMLAEQFYITKESSSAFNANGSLSIRTTKYYHYNDIIAISLNTKGQIRWTARVDKEQHSINDGGYFSSYAAFVVKDNIYLVYNEDVKDYFEKSDWKELSGKERNGKIALIVKLDKDGTQYINDLFLNERGEVLTRPKTYNQLSLDTGLLYGRWHKKHVLIKLDFH